MWQNFKDFLAQPYKSDMDAFGWFLFLGLLIILMILWRIIFSHIEAGA